MSEPYKSDIVCEGCGGSNTYVVDTRGVKDGKAIRRRRACAECRYRFTTYETKVGVHSRAMRALIDREVRHAAERITAAILGNFSEQ